ncbi:hypothetical protein K432DRAFT_285240, partial [Lepidopterella palustris CBS 459.81]
ELNRLATAATSTSSLLASSPPSPATLTRWATLFAYTRTDAWHAIQAHRDDLTRPRISDSHWSLVRAAAEANGYDRESYEHLLQLPEVLRAQSAVVPGKDGGTIFLIPLRGWLGSQEVVREICGGVMPKVVEGENGMGMGLFCLVDRGMKERIERWLVQKQGEALEMPRSITQGVTEDGEAGGSVCNAEVCD